MRWMYSGSNTSLRWSLITSANAFDETCYWEYTTLLGHSKPKHIYCYLVVKETKVCTHPKCHQILVLFTHFDPLPKVICQQFRVFGITVTVIINSRIFSSEE